MALITVQGFGMYDEGTATAGAPGTFAGDVPANFTDLTGSSPGGTNAAWTVGQYIVLDDASEAFWNGTSWQVGRFGVVPTFTAQAPTAVGTVGVAYGPYTFTATGTAVITFVVASGTLPTGLVLASGGALSGTPTTIGAFVFAVSAVNTSGTTTTANKTITIS